MRYRRRVQDDPSCVVGCTIIVTIQTGLNTKPAAESKDTRALGHVRPYVERSVDGLQVWHGHILKLSIEFNVAVDSFQLVEFQRWIVVAADGETPIDS